MRTIRLFPPTLASLASFLVLFAPQAPAQTPEPKRPPAPQGFVAEYDIPYVPRGDPAQVLDIIFPEKRAEKPQPLLVWIHGGGWTGGR
jgi:acetyl esterase/lipase